MELVKRSYRITKLQDKKVKKLAKKTKTKLHPRGSENAVIRELIEKA